MAWRKAKPPRRLAADAATRSQRFAFGGAGIASRIAGATNPNPGGGTFSGQGVSNGFFNPAGLSGTKTITYSVLPAGFDLPGAATLTIDVRQPVISSATVGVPSWREVTASILAPGWRRRILMSSTAVYPDPPRIATLVIRLGKRGVRNQRAWDNLGFTGRSPRPARANTALG